MTYVFYNLFNYFGPILELTVVYILLLAILLCYAVIFLIYATLIALFPKYLNKKDLTAADVVLLITFMIGMISILMLVDPNGLISKFFGKFILVASGMGTFLVAIITIFTVKQNKNQIDEMKEQRKSQYKPKLVPTDNYFDIYYENEQPKWKKHPKMTDVLSNNSIKYELKPIPYFEIYNIGKGYAKNVSVTLNIDYPRIIDHLRKYNKLEFEYSVDFGLGGHASVYFEPKHENILFNLDIVNLTSIEILPPSSEKPMVVYLPDQLIKLYVTLALKEERLEMSEPWPYEVILEYRDIDDNPIKESYILGIRPLLFKSKENENKELYGTLDFVLREKEKYLKELDERNKKTVNILFGE
ncbi:hypothetical protein HNP93_001365 [Methanococcus maripaludis]|uniref:Uncharacterized protein n=1 Tax=Methanococcus maripaludis TaxID=39152 RepID=A0A7J9P792_METMI|nr:hypothetical protein [Methanococcus maripaludis]MBA2858664.1 hypothetical protein [Methanococcus maripaludis]